MSKVATQSSSLKALDSVGRRLAGVYAEAFLAAAEKIGASGPGTTELREMVSALGGHDNERMGFLSSPTVTREIKAKVISGLSKAGASDFLIDFLHVLNDHDRVELLPAIADSVENILLDRNGKVKVLVTSATDLDTAVTVNLTENLKSKLGKEPVLQTNVNPDILGGLVIQVGDWVWDGSLSKQLDGLRDQLFERGNHAIQGGRDRFRSDR
jgi:F-type H+-transporting ATPase subunit delta